MQPRSHSLNNARFPAFHITQRNAMQEFLRNKKCCRLFYATSDSGLRLASCGASQANRNDFYNVSATPEANSTNQSCFYVQQLLIIVY